MSRVRIDLYQATTGMWVATAYVDRTRVWCAIDESPLAAQSEARDAVRRFFPEVFA